MDPPSSVGQSVNPSIRLSVSPSVRPSEFAIHFSIDQSVSPSVRQSVSPSVRQSVSPSVRQSVMNISWTCHEHVMSMSVGPSVFAIHFSTIPGIRACYILTWDWEALLKPFVTDSTTSLICFVRFLQNILSLFTKNRFNW